MHISATIHKSMYELQMLARLSVITADFGIVPDFEKL